MYAFYKGIFEYVGQMDLVILAVTQRRDKHHISRLPVMTHPVLTQRLEEMPNGMMFNIHRCLQFLIKWILEHKRNSLLTL